MKVTSYHSTKPRKSFDDAVCATPKKVHSGRRQSVIEVCFKLQFFLFVSVHFFFLKNVVLLVFRFCAIEFLLRITLCAFWCSFFMRSVYRKHLSRRFQNTLKMNLFYVKNDKKPLRNLRICNSG